MARVTNDDVPDDPGLSLEMLRNATVLSAEGFVFFDADARVTLRNPAVERLAPKLACCSICACSGWTV